MRRVDGRMFLSFFHIVRVGWGGAITSVSCLAFSLGCYANVRSLAQSGTQMSDRSWQNVKNFLLEHMYIKCKEKGHSIVRCTQVFLTTYTCGVGDKVSEQLHHGDFWQNWKNGSDQCHGQKWCWPKFQIQKLSKSTPRCGQTKCFATLTWNNHVQNTNT